ILNENNILTCLPRHHLSTHTNFFTFLHLPLLPLYQLPILHQSGRHYHFYFLSKSLNHHVNIVRFFYCPILLNMLPPYAFFSPSKKTNNNNKDNLYNTKFYIKLTSFTLVFLFILT